MWQVSYVTENRPVTATKTTYVKIHDQFNTKQHMHIKTSQKHTINEHHTWNNKSKEELSWNRELHKIEISGSWYLIELDSSFLDSSGLLMHFYCTVCCLITMWFAFVFAAIGIFSLFRCTNEVLIVWSSECLSTCRYISKFRYFVLSFLVRWFCACFMIFASTLPNYLHLVRINTEMIEEWLLMFCEPEILHGFDKYF